jgi:hypothetical protein
MGRPAGGADRRRLLLRLNGLRHFRRSVIPPLPLSADPVVGNQIIQIIKDSAFLTLCGRGCGSYERLTPGRPIASDPKSNSEGVELEAWECCQGGIGTITGRAHIAQVNEMPWTAGR